MKKILKLTKYEQIQEHITVDIYVQCSACNHSSHYDPDDGYNMRKIIKRLINQGWVLRETDYEAVMLCKECSEIPETSIAEHLRTRSKTPDLPLPSTRPTRQVRKDQNGLP